MSEQTSLTTVIKAKHIDEKGKLKNRSYYWILPEELTATVGDLAFVETAQGPQIVQIIDVRKWGEKRLKKVSIEIAKYSESTELKKVIAVQPKPKN